MTDAPIVSVWREGSSQWEFAGQVAGYESLACELRDDSAGTWSLTAPAGAAHLDKIDGAARVTVDWGGVRWATGRTTLPRHVREVSEQAAHQVVSITGDTGLALLGKVVCYPVPADPGLKQSPESMVGQTAASKLYSGPAETVVRDLVADHYRDRYGKDIVVPASLGRGAAVKERVKYTDLLTHVTAASQAGGVIADIGLVNTTGARADLTLGMRVPADVSLTAVLSEAIGSLGGWEYSQTRPTATKAIVGGGGTGATRVWLVVTTAASEALAAAWGGHVELFVDAADVFDLDELKKRGEAALAAAIVEDAFTLTATQAPGMRIWERAKPGDTVSVELSDVIATTAVLHGLRLEVSKDKGVTVTPIAGDVAAGDMDRREARQLRDAFQRIRNLEVTRGT